VPAPAFAPETTSTAQNPSSVSDGGTYHSLLCDLKAPP